MKKTINNAVVVALLLLSFVTKAQQPVTVTATVFPPFSTSFSYYINNPNKLQVTFINTSSQPIDVYAQGRLTGDNGVEISSDPAWHPAIPITLYPGVPYYLTQENIGTVFSSNHIIYTGTSQNELLTMGGLPEGNYQFCFSVYDFNNGNQISDEDMGCSNMIIITYVDPPVILNPICGDSLTSTTPQNVLISWTTAVGTGPNIRYRFIMTEMLPDSRDPNDAMASASPPYFLEKDLSIPQLLIGPADPPLIKGRSYAFIVQAYDPANQVIFNNNGTSEVCWFKYKAPLTFTIDSTITTSTDIDGFIHDFDFIPQTSIHGQLHYKLASDAGLSGTSGNSNSSGGGFPDGGINFIYIQNNNSGNGNANSNNLSLGGFTNMGFHNTQTTNLTLTPPLGTGDMNGKVYSVGNAEPLRNTTIRLVARFGTSTGDGFFKMKNLGDGTYSNLLNVNRYKFYDLNGEEVNKEKVLSVVGKTLDVCTTDNQGNFSFDFMTDYFTGPVYAVSSGNSFGSPDYIGVVSLRIEVENQKFCSPDINLFTKPGDVVTTPPQVALIKDYNLKLTVVSAYDVYNHIKEGSGDTTHFTNYDTKPKAIAGGEPIPNAIVRVLRNAQKLDNEHPAVLLSEGSQQGKIIQTDYGEFKEVFYGKSNVNGLVNIPHLVEHWAITDGEDESPYLFYVRTREENVDSAYSNTLYNYEPFFGTIKGLRLCVDAGGPTELDDDAGFNGTQPVTYNHLYTPPQSANDREVRLEAANPEIQGRLMAASNLENIPVKNTPIKLYKQLCETCNSGFFDMGSKFTNNAGFFRFTNLDVDVNENGNAIGPFRRLYFKNSIYKQFYWPPQNQQALNLKYGELYFKEFQLEPKQKLKGKVIDEEGNPVASYIKLLPNAPYVKTEKQWEYDNNGNIYVYAELFETAAQYGTNQFEVQPLSNNFFADTISVSGFTPGVTQTFTVYRKRHRLRLQLYDKVSHGVIANATVIVGDTLAIGKTNSAGVAELTFASPGQQFLIRVFAENYTPTQASYNIPVSKNWQNETLQIHYALHISGIVTEKTSGQPVDSAMIYTELQNTDGHTLFLETYSDANGNYTLNGLPWYDTPTVVRIHAVKSGKNPSYIGQEKAITIKSSMTTSGHNFQIKAANGWDLSNIWGFPVTVEKMTSKVNTGTFISGYFSKMPHHPDFNTINDNEKVYFKSLKVTKGTNGEIIPKNSFVKTESYTLPIKINGGFEGNLFRYYAQGSFLKVVKKSGVAELSGNLKIDLSSFNFAYDFAGDLYIGDDTTKTGITLFSSHFNSGGSGFYINKHFLFDHEKLFTIVYPKPITDFRVFGFNASSNFSGSYLQNGVIHIATILHTDIPMPLGRPSLDLKIDAGEIRITKENMDLVHNPNSQLRFDLEKWKVVSTNGWTFDKTRDAIVIPRGTIYTGLGVDAGIKGLNIRPDALREGEIDLSKGLSLGGIATLTVDNNMKPVFNYDAGVGHYRISLVGQTSNSSVAWLDNLPATPDRLEFTSIGMLSDNSTILSLGKTMRFHNLMDVFVDQIMSGEGFFRLAGMPDLGIPGYIATRAEMTYTKENGNLKFRLEPLSGGIDCNANIDFDLEQIRSSQSLTNRLFTSYGTFHIKPPPGEGGEKLTIRGFLTKTPTQCYIDVVTPQNINMGKETMSLIDGKISVTGNSWNELNFTAHTQSQGLDDANIMAFNVHGGIEAGADNVKVDKIDTPLGDLNMAYIFAEKALVGNLTVAQPVNMGFAGLNSGMMAMRFDPNGFYLGFSGSLTITANTYAGGFILGDYDHDLNAITAPMLSGFETGKPDFSSLHGFYAIGQRELINVSFPLLIIDVSVKAGLGTYIHFDYDKELFQIGGYGYAKAKGGVNITGCGFVGVSQSGYANVVGTYEAGNLSISTCQTLETCVGACGLNGCITMLSRTKLSTAGNDVILKLGGSCSDYGD